MNHLFLIISFYLSIVSFSQKKYHFDYALIYDNPISLDKETQSYLYFINSKDNSYRTLVSFENDSLNVSLRLTDYKGLYINAIVKKENFYEAETFSNDCNSVYRFSNKFKYKTKEYDFIKHQDTIINDTIYFHYSIKCNKSLAYQKRNAIVTSHYIIDKNSEQFKPFLYHSTVYNKWFETLKLPNGIIKIKYDVNVEGEIIFKQELIKVIQINKFFTIPEVCDYTKSPK